MSLTTIGIIVILTTVVFPAIAVLGNWLMEKLDESDRKNGGW